MVQVLQNNKKPSFSEQISRGIDAAIPGIQGFLQQREMQQTQQAQARALQQAGIDPSVLNLPPEAKSEYFKNAFTKEKGLNPLQLSQKDLIDKKLKYADELEGNVSGKDESSENMLTSNKDLNRLEFEEKPKSKKAKSKEIYDQELIPEEKIQKAALVFPAVATQMQHHNDKVLAERRHKEEMDFKKSEAGKKHEWNIHSESQKYDEEIQHNARTAKKQVMAVQDIEKAVASGKVKPSSWTNIFKGFGVIGDKIANAIMNKDEATLLSSIPQLLEGWKQVFGVRLTDADLRLLEDKLPGLGKSQEANKAVLKIMKKYSDQTLLREKIASEIKSKNKGMRPLDFANKVETRFDEMTMPIKIKNPHTGNVIEVPAYKVGDFIEDGGVIVNE